jgi:hypothetical protein
VSHPALLGGIAADYGRLLFSTTAGWHAQMPLPDPRVLVTTGCNAALEQGPHVLGVE